jgi:hypothetical protein
MTDVILGAIGALRGHRLRLTFTVVYFTPDGNQQFTTGQLRELVFQKAPANPAALVCYCFQHSLEAIQEADAPTRAQIVADMTSFLLAEVASRLLGRVILYRPSSYALRRGPGGPPAPARSPRSARHVQRWRGSLSSPGVDCI